MKITIDTKTGEIKSGGKLFKELNNEKRNVAESFIRKFLRENTKLTAYDEDNMWMSYRYCIGRHTIASHMHAGDIWKNCRGRLHPDRELFTAFDINREIENSLCFHKPYFHFPITSLNRIYTTAVDIVCEFMEDYEIKSIDDLLKYRDINIILTDNERGYKFETTTWKEWLSPQITKFFREMYDNDCMSEDKVWELFELWKSGNNEMKAKFDWKLMPLISDMPSSENYFMHDFEDLFVWNDLVHCFDYEHHHKSILIDGTKCEWFWSWTENTEQHDDGYYYKSFGYHKIRVPLDKWNGNVTTWIPDESIKEDIY